MGRAVLKLTYSWCMLRERSHKLVITILKGVRWGFMVHAIAYCWDILLYLYMYHEKIRLCCTHTEN